MTARTLWLEQVGCRWPVARLKDHVRISNGFPFESRHFNSTTGTRVVRIRDLTDGVEPTYVDDVVPSASLISSGDVIVGMDGDFTAVTWTNGPAALNQRLCALRPRPSLDRRFLAYVLPAPLKAINDVTYFTTVKHLSSIDLLDERIPLPPLSVQRAVADYLDRETARIDDLVAAKSRMVQLLGERDYAMLSSIFVPEDCRLAQLRHFATIQSGLAVDASRDPGPDAATLPYLRVANVQAGHLDLIDVTEVTVSRALAARTTLRRNDVLMTEGGDIDKLGRGTVWAGELDSCLHQNHIFAVRPDQRILDPWYLALLTRSAHARSYFESTGVQSTNLASTSSAKILSFPIPVLPLEKQESLVSEWRRIEAPTIRLRRTLKAQIELLQERRRAVITSAVTGHLDIPEAP